MHAGPRFDSPRVLIQGIRRRLGGVLRLSLIVHFPCRHIYTRPAVGAGLLVDLDGIALGEPEFLVTFVGNTVCILIRHNGLAGWRPISSFQAAKNLRKRLRLVVVRQIRCREKNFGGHKLPGRKNISGRLCVVWADLTLVLATLAADHALPDASEPGTILLRRFLN